MKTYELTYIITPEISFEEAEAKAKEIESLIKDNEGSVLSRTNPTAETFAYPIKKSASGFLGIMEFEMEPENLANFQNKFSKHGAVIRKMIAAKKKIKKDKRGKTIAKLSEVFKTGGEPEDTKSKTEKPAEEKVELKDIEQKLNELLGE